MRTGGAERVLQQMLNYLMGGNSAFQVDLLLAKKEGILLKGLDGNINIVDFNKKHVRDCLIDLVGYLKINKPNVFISILDYVNIVASLAHIISRCNSKLILWEHSIISYHSKKTISKLWIIRYFLIRMFYNHAHKIITVSKGAKDDLISHYSINKQKIKIINNPIDIQSVISLSEAKVKVPCINYKNENYIVSVGRLATVKNYKLLIEAFSKLSKIFNYKLVIIGDGPEYQNLQKQITGLNLENRIILTGFLENPYPLIKNANVFVISSKWEGFPLVLLEALALKRQIVSTDSPSGPREILDNGKLNLMVPVDNSDALSNGILQILDGEIKFDEDLLLQRASEFRLEKKCNEFMKFILRCK